MGKFKLIGEKRNKLFISNLTHTQKKSRHRHTAHKTYDRITKRRHEAS